MIVFEKEFLQGIYPGKELVSMKEKNVQYKLELARFLITKNNAEEL